MLSTIALRKLFKSKHLSMHNKAAVIIAFLSCSEFIVRNFRLLLK